MPISSSGPISISQIRQEFGSITPEFTAISKYYRGGGIVPIGASSTIPTSGTISLSNFYGSSNLILVTYELIGAGGAGGAGDEDGPDFAPQFGIGTFGGSGGSSTLTIPGVGIITAAGGNGGENSGRFGLPYDQDRVGGTGAGTAYGPGGVGGPRNTVGGNAPITSYGAGGGGGGGDEGSLYDSAGFGGSGGGSGIRRTGTFSVQPGTVITFTIGNGGEPSENYGPYVGGFGAGGYLRISYPSGRVSTTVVERIVGGSLTIG